MRLTAQGLSIGYGRRVVGADIALEVMPGRVLCLLGPNGCGKTTLFRTLLGLLAPLGGEIRLGDRPLGALRRDRIARALAYVPQAHAPPFPYEAREVVLMGRSARLGAFGQPGAADRAAAEAALARLGIAELAGQDYSRLSGGQRQLVLIARALAQETPLIVMDEPTASLDFANQAQVLAQIAALARPHAGDGNDDRGGHGIILSTHDPDQAFALGADVLAMKAGRIIASGPCDSVLNDETLSTLYGLPVSVETTGSGRRVCLPRQTGQTRAPDQ